MNVGIVTSWYERGAAYVSRAYMNALSKHGTNVQIYGRGGRLYADGDPNWDSPNVTWGVRYEPLDRISGFTNQYICMVHCERWLRKHDIEVIIFNEEHGFRPVKRAKQMGYVVGAYVDYYTKGTVQQFVVYDFLLCNTQRHFGVFRDFPNCFFIPWGTDVDLYKPRTHSDREDTDDAVVFFHSAGWGGVNNRKGTDLLLDAFRRVTGQARLVLHSQASISKYGEASAEIVGNDSRIQFIEKAVPAPGLYHLGDVFVYPSRLEGIGLCVPEALACGLPVITTNNAPMNEFVADGVNGLLVRVKETRMRGDAYYWPETIPDVEHLAEQMQRYVDDRESLAAHKEQARKWAEDKLDWSRNAADLPRILETLVAGTHRERRRPSPVERLIWRSEAQYVASLTCARRAAKKLLRRP
jgi:glycosyltransferase involved in cell wall biosynthesis